MLKLKILIRDEILFVRPPWLEIESIINVLFVKEKEDTFCFHRAI